MFTHNRKRIHTLALTLLTLALLLSVGWISPDSARLNRADWIEVPVSGRYITPERAAVDLQHGVDGLATIHTTALTGELYLDAQEIPPAFGVPVPGCARIPFNQDLTLEIDLAQGLVKGTSHATISTQDGSFTYAADVQGSVSCQPYNGESCGQLRVDLDFDGLLSDSATASLVGRLQLKTRWHLAARAGHPPTGSTSSRLGAC